MRSCDCRLRARVARAIWSQALKDAKSRKVEVAEALAALMPPAEYARAVVELTKSHDTRVRARGLELLAKLQGLVEDTPASGGAVVAFRTVLSGQQVERHQGGDGHQSRDEEPSEAEGTGTG